MSISLIKLLPVFQQTLIINALVDKPLPVYGNGLNVRDWLYVEDHCVAIDLILRHGEIGQVYNIGGHNELRNIDLVKKILSILGKPKSLICYVTDRKGHDMRYAIDSGMIGKKLGWQPITGFNEGIRKTVEWYLSHRPWLEDIISGEYQNYYERMYTSK